MEPVSSRKDQPFMKLFANKQMLLILAVIILVAPLLMRGSALPIGKEPYLLDRLSNQFSEKGIIETDTLSYSGRAYVYPLATVAIISWLKEILPNTWVIIGIPILLGILSVWIFYNILQSYGLKKKESSIGALLLVISPPFIFTFSYLKEFTIPIFLMLIALYTLLTHKKKGLGYAILAIMPLFGIEHALVSILILALVYEKKQKTIVMITAGILVLLLLAVYLPVTLAQGVPEITIFKERSPLFKLFSDFGSEFGISIFMFFLAIFGLKDIWVEKYKHKKVYVAIIVLLVFLVINPEYTIYLNLVLIPLAALGIIYIFRKKWESKTIKDLTLIIFVLGLLFSSASFLNTYKNPQPSQPLVDALGFIEQTTQPAAVILYHHSKGIWINAIAKRPNVMDEKTFYAPSPNERFEDINILFQSRNLEITKEILNRYNIRYILITPDMKQGRVWDAEEQGLLFVLKFTPEYFERVYKIQNIEIWKVNL